jgi:malonyl CoA-acyl carrier protein transacylase
VNTQPVMLTGRDRRLARMERRRRAEARMRAGHSLGEYTALVAAGALAFRDAVPLVRFPRAGDAGRCSGGRWSDGRNPRLSMPLQSAPVCSEAAAKPVRGASSSPSISMDPSRS